MTYQEELDIAIKQINDRIDRRGKCGVSFCDTWSYGWGHPTTCISFGSWNVKYKDDIVAHYSNSYKVTVSYRHEIWSVLIENK